MVNETPASSPGKRVYLDLCALNRPPYLPEETMVKRGLEALMAALGPVETARFLNLPRQRYGDYVEWHRQWQSGLDPQRFFDEVFRSAPDADERGAA